MTNSVVPLLAVVVSFTVVFHVWQDPHSYRGRFDPRIQVSSALKPPLIPPAPLTLNPGTSMFPTASFDASDNHPSQDFV